MSESSHGCNDFSTVSSISAPRVPWTLERRMMRISEGSRSQTKVIHSGLATSLVGSSTVHLPSHMDEELLSSRTVPSYGYSHLSTLSSPVALRWVNIRTRRHGQVDDSPADIPDTRQEYGYQSGSLKTP